jgi:hypothetical protein
MELSQTLIKLELRLLSQATRSDAEEISRLLADDFIEFGASGSIWTKSDVVEQLPHQTFTQRTISEFTVKQLSEDAALVTYRCQTSANDQRRSTISLRSSIWRRTGEHWQMVFHQGTPLPRS